MNIDQVQQKIYNSDSLIYESDASAVLATVSAIGTIAYRVDDPDSTEWKTYSSTDSINFSKPLIFRVFSEGGTMMKDYSVRVNIHKQESEVFKWSSIQKNATALNGLTDKKALVHNDSVKVFGLIGGQLYVAVSGVEDGKTWSRKAATGCAQAEPASLQQFGGKLYMTSTDGVLYGSADGYAWTTVCKGAVDKTVGATSMKLYGLKDGKIVSSADGATWSAEAMDESTDLLPTQDMTSVTYTMTTNSALEKIFLIGSRNTTTWAADTSDVVWAKVEDTTGATTNDWAYYNTAPDNHKVCPRLENLQVISYDGCMLAFGGKELTGSGVQALSAFYQSPDNGITWSAMDNIVAPTELIGTTDRFAATVDSHNYIWIINNGDVWKGRLNRLGFATNNIAFTKRNKAGV